MLKRLNHVALAVPDLPAAAAFYRDVLGADVSTPVDLPEQGVTIVFVSLSNTKLELLTPLGDNSPITRFLAKNPKGGLHHLCFEVEDLLQSVECIKTAGVRILGEPSPGAQGVPIVFMHPQDTFGCLLELEEKRS